MLTGPHIRLNAILSLLQPLDRYRNLSAIRSVIARPYLALSRIHAQVGVLNRLVLNRLGAQPRDSGAIVAKTPFKTSAKQKCDRGRDSQPRSQPRLNCMEQGLDYQILSLIQAGDRGCDAVVHPLTLCLQFV